MHQLFRRVHLSYVPIFENQDPVVVQHRVQTVGDGDNCAETERERVSQFELISLINLLPAVEFLPDSSLNEIVRLQVDGRGCLIQDEDLGLPEESPGQADELSLAG